MSYSSRFRISLVKLWSQTKETAWTWKDPSNLAVTRILFGLLMMIDIHFERGFAEIDHKFGDPQICHFPLFDFLKPLPFQWMCQVYLVMWLGAVGITFGYNFKLSCLSFIIPYWYILLLDKSSWNNHSYLYGLLSILLLFSSANHYLSVDSALNPSIKNKSVPMWNYILIRFQVFLLYFFAGLKKLDSEWLGGYSMKNYGSHWVFTPFKILLSEEAIEYFIVHLGGFILDLTIGFWLLWPKSRPYAMFFCASFHFMNSQMFSIGMFPYMCLATLPVFCSDDWPKTLISRTPNLVQKFCLPTEQSSSCGEVKKSNWKLFFMSAYVITQLTLPWSHSITQGYNNWTNGLYGYSWDMMVHGWQTMHVVVSVEHKSSGLINYLDTEAFVRNDKWVGHADMVYQYAHCVKEKLELANMTDVAIYVDVWRSLNGRFQQRLFDPRVDLLTAKWSPFQPTPWLMPLLTELTPWRKKLDQIERNIFNWSQSASVAFVADFPGLKMENYVPAEVTNASLLVLEGKIELTFPGQLNNMSLILKTNETTYLPSSVLHTVTTISPSPACYMYTYMNLASVNSNSTDTDIKSSHLFAPFAKSLALVAQSILNLVFGIPLVASQQQHN